LNLENLFKKTFPIFSIIVLIILSFYVIRFAFLPGWENINSDFPNYYTSSKLILEGEDLENIYNDFWFQQNIKKYGMNDKGKFSPFPPVTSFVMLFPALFNPITAKRIYLSINFLLLFFSAYIFYKITNISFINCMIIILLSGVAIINNFLLGQFYLLLLFLIVLGYYLTVIKKPLYGGLLWGIGAAVKYFPFVFLPAFLKKNNQKVLLGFFISVAILNFIGIYIFGWGVYKNFIVSAFLPHLNGELSHQSQFAHQFQSWNSFLRIVFVFNPVANPNPFINWVFGFTIIKTFIYIIVLVFTVLSFVKLKDHIDENSLHLSLLSVAMLLLSPASASYHYILLVFPTILILTHSIKRKELIYGLSFLIIYSLIGFLPMLLHRIIVNYETNLFFSFHRLWLITIYFILLIYFLFKVTKKEKVNKNNN